MGDEPKAPVADSVEYPKRLAADVNESIRNRGRWERASAATIRGAYSDEQRAMTKGQREKMARKHERQARKYERASSPAKKRGRRRNGRS